MFSQLFLAAKLSLALRTFFTDVLNFLCFLVRNCFLLLGRWVRGGLSRKGWRLPWGGWQEVIVRVSPIRESRRIHQRTKMPHRNQHLTVLITNRQRLLQVGWSSAPWGRVSWPDANTAWSCLAPCALWRVKAGCTCWKRPTAWHSDYRSPQSSVSGEHSAVPNSAPKQRCHRTPDNGNPEGDWTN